jgi:hypothetical protein
MGLLSRLPASGDHEAGKHQEEAFAMSDPKPTPATREQVLEAMEAQVAYLDLIAQMLLTLISLGDGPFNAQMEALKIHGNHMDRLRQRYGVGL